MAPNRDATESIVNTIYNQRFLRRGPKIVAIGGGTGLSTLLRGLKEYTGNLTAIVTVADDGGSSGVLRREFGVLPPGDVRNCIAALADAEPLVTKLFQYRFSDGSGLAGHSLRQPVHRRHVRRRRQLRGRHPPDQPRARGARPDHPLDARRT